MQKVRIGLLGSGTVGGAIQDFVFNDLHRKTGNDTELRIVKIYTRRPAEKKWYGKYPTLFTTKPEEVIDHPEADIIVEALGSQGEEDLIIFRDYILRAFEKGKGVVTSDKAVLAKFGAEIWETAERYGRGLRFEACVGGGIPVIRSLTESFAAELPEAIYGIINGTSHYILSEMAKSGKSYEEALREAQGRGYAETNPKSDTSGADAECKLILLAAVTFGLRVKPGKLWRKGIEEIHALDFLYADRRGRCTIKPLAVAKNDGGAIQAFVAPVLVPHDHFLATVDGATNALFFKGERSGGGESRTQKGDWDYVFIGPGAGGGPTAVAVLGDVYDLATASRPAGLRSLVRPGTFNLQPEDQLGFCFYTRFVVRDRAGIVGDICQAFGELGIHISEVWQLNHDQDELRALAQYYRLREKPEEILPFVITLERATIGQIKRALEIICRKDYILAEPVWLPIWRN